MPAKITVQVFKGREVIGEYAVTVQTADNEQQAVDIFMSHARADMQFKFLGNHGFITPSGTPSNPHAGKGIGEWVRDGGDV